MNADQDPARIELDAMSREGAARLSLALEAGRLGDWSWIAATDVVTLSPRAAKIFGLPLGEPITWTRLRDLLHEEHREVARLAVQTALDTKTEYDIEYRVRRPSGEDCWIAARGRGTYREDGAILGMIGVVQDITARKAAEEQLRAQELQLRLIFEHAAVGIAIADLSGRFLEVNRRFADILGFSRDELTALSFRDMTHPDDLAETNEQARKLLAGEIQEYRIEKRYIRKDGAVIWVLATVTKTQGESGAPERFIGVIEDITPRRKVEEALQSSAEERSKLLESERHARSQAERLSAIKDEFLAVLSHELRTPLSAILGWTHIMRHRVGQQEGPESAELHKGLEVIERNARMQTQLIEDLLDMSRIASGKMRLDVRPLDPLQIIDGAAEMVRPSAALKNITLELSCEPSPGVVTGDGGRLQQVVWNLLSNAIKFTPKGGSVQVRVARAGDQLEISVADSGIGIRGDFLEHVFERFRQGDASTTRKHGGLGLGLAIVKQLVELHGGSVRASSAGEGRGATFTVALPLAEGVARREPEPPRLPSTPPPSFKSFDLRGLIVLVVDDEPDARTLVARVLDECGADVYAAARAADALIMAERARPHVIVSDIGMPDIDGFELLRRLRALGPERGGEVPVIALTAFAREEDRDRTLAAGFSSHLTKPIELSGLVAMVAALAGRSS